MPDVLDLWKKTTAFPLGDRVFSLVFSQMAPYFATVRPRFTVLEPNRAELVIRKRRGVHNHIKTVHVIAICNGLEAAMGALAEATVPAGKRWIPKGMEVTYPAKADTDITCIAETDPAQWTGDADPAERLAQSDWLRVTSRPVRPARWSGSPSRPRTCAGPSSRWPSAQDW